MRGRAFAILSAALLSLLSSGCITTCRRLDGDLGTAKLLGLRCVVSKTVRLPVAYYWHFPRISFEEFPDDPGEVEIDQGTILRIDHVELCQAANNSIDTVQAEAENGRQQGKRVVIGKTFGWYDHPNEAGVFCWNEYEGLSPETGQVLVPLGPRAEARIFHYPDHPFPSPPHD
jgi:hypothetical protein